MAPLRISTIVMGQAMKAHASSQANLFWKQHDSNILNDFEMYNERCRKGQLEALKTTDISHLNRRWEYHNVWGSSSTNGLTRSWSWSQTTSWAGHWEVGQLFLWTFLILGCMIGGFLLIAFIFCSCGFLDERRLKRNRRKVAARQKELDKQGYKQKQSQKMTWKSVGGRDDVSPKAPEMKCLGSNVLDEVAASTLLTELPGGHFPSKVSQLRNGHRGDSEEIPTLSESSNSSSSIPRRVSRTSRFEPTGCHNDPGFRMPTLSENPSSQV